MYYNKNNEMSIMKKKNGNVMFLKANKVKNGTIV